MKSLACLAAFVVLASMLPAQTPASGSSKATPPAKMLSQVIDWQKLVFTPTKTGQRVAVFEAPTPTLDKFHCHISTLNPGENTGALHRHPQEELVIIKEGTLEINIDGKIQTATAGSMIFYSANENENMRNIGKTPATYYVIQFWTPSTPKE
jgi:mannose-6-phosphate isomerase-like protein (cupin superfamily)